MRCTEKVDGPVWVLDVSVPSNSANCNGHGAMSVPVSLCGDSGDGGNP